MTREYTWQEVVGFINKWHPNMEWNADTKKYYVCVMFDGVAYDYAHVEWHIAICTLIDQCIEAVAKRVLGEKE